MDTLVCDAWILVTRYKNNIEIRRADRKEYKKNSKISK